MKPIFEPLSQIDAIPLVIPGDDVDTDQIIPAQFLTTTSRKGLGNKAFYAWRYDENGNDNALKNGMAAIDVSSDVSEQLHTKSHQNILVDLETCHIVSGTDDPIKFELDALSLECLMSGQDQLEKLMEHLPARDKFEAQNTLHFEALI